MKLDELFDELRQHLTVDDHSAREARDRVLTMFADACRRFDDDRRERQRIRDIADLIDAEDALYDEAIAALDRGDQDRALPLLHHAARAEIGEAAWLLAGLLEERGQTAEAITWYRQSAADGDSRASAKLAELYALRALPSHKLRPGTTDEHPAAQPESRDYASLQAYSIVQLSTAGKPSPQQDFGPPYLPRLRIDPWQGLKAPHHRVISSTKDLSRWETKIRKTLLAVEGPADEAAAQRFLSNYAYHRLIVVLNTCRSQAAAQPDLITSMADGQLQLWEVKAAKYLRNCFSAHYRSFWAETLAASATSWQMEYRAAPEAAASDVMTPLAALTTLTPSTTVHQALGQVLQADAHALLVCDGGQVVGVVTLADLARCIHDSRVVLSIERVETLVHPPAAVGMAAPLSMVRGLMAREGTGLVAVTGPGGMIVGCVTTQSLLAHEPSGKDAARPQESSRLIPLLRPDNGTVKLCMPV